MSGSNVFAMFLASSGVYPPECSNSCANTPMKRLSSAGSPLRFSTPVRLDPAICSLVHCASPNSDRIVSQSRVGQFKHDAANIFICEEVIPCELHVIEIAVYVEKERIAAPTKEKAVTPGFRHQGFPRD